MADPITLKPGEETAPRPRGERGPMDPPYLVLADGPRRGTRFPLQEGENLVGRGPWSHILLEDQSVSRRHCVVERSGETITVRDLGSRNGTRVNGQQTTDAVTVGHADLIQLGIYTLRIITREVSAEEEMAPIEVASAPVKERVAGPEIGTREVSEEAAAEEGEEEGEEEGGEMVPADAEQALVAEEAEERPRRLRMLVIVLGSLAVLGVGGYFAYQEFAPAPPPPPAKMVTRVIPSAPAEPLALPEPKEIPIFVDFASSPMPAKVIFLGKDYGLTPIKVNVPLTVDEQYTAEGHFTIPEFKEEHVERITFVMARDKSLIPIFFRAPIGIFKVKRLPRQVELSLQAFFSYDQFTPRNATLADVSYGKPMYVPYGRYIIELRRPKEIGGSGQFVDDIRYRREIFLTEESPTFTLNVEDIDLEQFPVEIRTTPSGAQVFMDTAPVGKTPFTGNFPLGEHTLVLRKEGYFEHSQILKNDINVIYRLDVPLKTTRAGELINDSRQLVLKGRYKEAIAKLSTVFEQDAAPIEAAEAQYLLGTAFFGMKDFKTAQGYFEQSEAHEAFELRAKLGRVRILTQQLKRLEALPVLVEVMLRAKDPAVLAEARSSFKEVSPLKSVIYVRTEPAGATVFVNDEAMKTKTPLILHDLGLGHYKIRVEREDHLPKEVGVNLTIHEFNPIIIDLTPVK